MIIINTPFHYFLTKPIVQKKIRTTIISMLTITSKQTITVCK